MSLTYMTVGKTKLQYGPNQHLEERVSVTSNVYAINVAKTGTVKTTSRDFKMDDSLEALEI
jgi:hypothetical protein